MQIRTAPILLTAMAVAAVVVIVSAGQGIAQEKADHAAFEASVEAARTAPDGFVLGIWEGQLAFFREGAARPFRVLEMPVVLLPAADRAALADGIHAADMATLRAMAEDYLP